MCRLVTLCGTGITLQPTDIEENNLITMLLFFNGGCGCLKYKGNNCALQFSVSELQESRLQCQQLSHGELDMHLLGQWMAFGDISGNTSSEWRHSPTPRVRIQYSYHHRGKSVCLKTFLFVHANIAKSYHEH